MYVTVSSEKQSFWQVNGEFLGAQSSDTRQAGDTTIHAVKMIIQNIADEVRTTATKCLVPYRVIQ